MFIGEISQGTRLHEMPLQSAPRCAQCMPILHQLALFVSTGFGLAMRPLALLPCTFVPRQNIGILQSSASAIIIFVMCHAHVHSDCACPYQVRSAWSPPLRCCDTGPSEDVVHGSAYVLQSRWWSHARHMIRWPAPATTAAISSLGAVGEQVGLQLPRGVHRPFGIAAVENVCRSRVTNVTKKGLPPDGST
jgi:hypothetical protein